MKAETEILSTEKLNGRFYTPEYIVNNILDMSGYHDSRILNKHVIDNSCGDGAFLVCIVKRYCTEFLKRSDDIARLSNDLSQYVHGIELDKTECLKCINNLNELIKSYGVSKVDWDINCADTLTVTKYNGKMDFVLGNPPYVRVHNLGDTFDDIKKYSFAQNGMTDLYIVFYEIGLNMLNQSGVLGYITPSSFFNSLAGKYMRSYLVENNLIDKIVDLKHYQAFSATTYSAIAILKKNRKIKTVDFYQFEERNCFPYYVDTLQVSDYYINSNFYFSDKESLNELKRILSLNLVRDNFTVKNGFATLADNFFIGDFEFDEYIIPIVKASTGKMAKCFFPYRNDKLIEYDELTSNINIKEYFERNKDMLSKRSLDAKSEWYGFGRSQGINDVYKCKYAINTLIRNIDDIKLVKCDRGVGVYSGLYILTKLSESELRELLYSNDFVNYVSMLGKYKNGGYYTFSSKDLKNYLEYKYSQRNDYSYEQLPIFIGT